jgi:DNA-binding NtrC family response regulator
MAKRQHEETPFLASTASRQRPEARSRAPAGARLHVVHPGEIAEVIELSPGESCLLGRSTGEGSVALKHSTVSRRHFQIAWDRTLGAHTGADLGSRNGSSVDGDTVGPEPRPIPDGSVVRLGDVLLVYEMAVNLPDDPVEVAREAIPGASLPMMRLRAAAMRAAADPAPVLIVGETGSGKERIAAELHRLSGRKGRLVTVNCAALTPQLVESQLFGHMKGAFTGATDSQPGLFVTADQGTLFLDEIGELPLDLQAKLLRAIEQGEVRAVGSTRSQRVDVRVLAATNRDLAGAAEMGTFRRDLYARLSLWELHVPPLRKRRADLLWWVERLRRDWLSERGTAHKSLVFEADAAEELLLASWPLNLRAVNRLIRELDAARPVARADLPKWFDEPDTATQPATPAAKKPIPTKAELEAAHKQLNGSVHALARHFGRDRRQIYRWLEQHGLRAKR